MPNDAPQSRKNAASGEKAPGNGDAAAANETGDDNTPGGDQAALDPGHAFESWPEEEPRPELHSGDPDLDGDDANDRDAGHAPTREPRHSQPERPGGGKWGRSVSPAAVKVGVIVLAVLIVFVLGLGACHMMSNSAPSQRAAAPGRVLENKVDSAFATGNPDYHGGGGDGAASPGARPVLGGSTAGEEAQAPPDGPAGQNGSGTAAPGAATQPQAQPPQPPVMIAPNAAPVTTF